MWDALPVAIVEGRPYSKVCDALEEIVGTDQVLGMVEPQLRQEETITPTPIHRIVE